MRLLLTVHQFLPEYASGTEILTLHTAQELQRRGHEVTVFTGYPAKVPLRDGERFDAYEHEGIRVERFLHQHMPMGAQTNIVEMEYRNELFGRRFRAFLKERPQDVVHFFHIARLTATAIDAAVDAGVATAFTTTDFWPLCPTSQLRLPDGSLCTGPGPFAANCVRHLVEVSQPPDVARRLRLLPDAAVAGGVAAIQNDLLPERWYSSFVRAISARPDFIRQRMNKLDRLLVPTRLMEKLLTANGFRPSRLSFIPYGVQMTHIRRDTRKGTREKLRLGFIGTLYEHKGCHLLIDAVRSLGKDFSVELKIYGKLDEFPEYVAQLRQRAGDAANIAFMGTFPNTLIGDIFAGLDALVVPSIWYENTPLVIYSAMASGCPVVATNLGGMSEAVGHRVNGMLFEKGNVVELAAELAELARDRGLLRQLAEKTKIPKSIPEYVDDVEAIYSQIIAERRLRGRAAV